MSPPEQPAPSNGGSHTSPPSIVESPHTLAPTDADHRITTQMVATTRVMAPSLVFRGSHQVGSGDSASPDSMHSRAPASHRGYTRHPRPVNQKVASAARKFALDHRGLARRGEPLRSGPRGDRRCSTSNALAAGT